MIISPSFIQITKQKIILLFYLLSLLINKHDYPDKNLKNKPTVGIFQNNEN